MCIVSEWILLEKQKKIDHLKQLCYTQYITIMCYKQYEFSFWNGSPYSFTHSLTLSLMLIVPLSILTNENGKYWSVQETFRDFDKCIFSSHGCAFFFLLPLLPFVLCPILVNTSWAQFSFGKTMRLKKIWVGQEIACNMVEHYLHKYISHLSDFINKYFFPCFVRLLAQLLLLLFCKSCNTKYMLHLMWTIFLFLSTAMFCSWFLS